EEADLPIELLLRELVRRPVHLVDPRLELVALADDLQLDRLRHGELVLGGLVLGDRADPSLLHLHVLIAKTNADGVRALRAEQHDEVAAGAEPVERDGHLDLEVAVPLDGVEEAHRAPARAHADVEAELAVDAVRALPLPVE